MPLARYPSPASYALHDEVMSMMWARFGALA